jgi:phosphonate transport system substrate-binding protein
MLKRPLALAAGLVLSCCAVVAQAADVLRVSAIPDEAPTELLRKFKPLGEYLEKQLGMEVKFVPVADYPAVVESLASNRLDLAWLGGFTFVQVHLKDPTATPLVQREQDAQFTSKFITANPDVKSLADLKGKTFAFGSISSTSGSLMPRYFMLKKTTSSRKTTSAASPTPAPTTPPWPGCRPARSMAACSTPACGRSWSMPARSTPAR